jgi:hypothetical protein
MKRDKKFEKEAAENSNLDSYSLPPGSDQAILEQINKRNEENQALKKLLDNLNTSFPKHEAKS